MTALTEKINRPPELPNLSEISPKDKDSVFLAVLFFLEKYNRTKMLYEKVDEEIKENMEDYEYEILWLNNQEEEQKSRPEWYASMATSWAEKGYLRSLGQAEIIKRISAFDSAFEEMEIVAASESGPSAWKDVSFDDILDPDTGSTVKTLDFVANTADLFLQYCHLMGIDGPFWYRNPDITRYTDTVPLLKEIVVEKVVSLGQTPLHLTQAK